MTRKILMAVMLVLLLVLPATVGAVGFRQYGIYGGFIGQEAMSPSLTVGTTSFVFGGLMCFDERWLIDLNTTVVVDESQMIVQIPDHTAFAFGSLVGNSAMTARFYWLTGVDFKQNEITGTFNAGPKINVGVMIPLQSTTLLALGPQMSYIFADKTTNYGLAAKLVWKFGPPTATDMGAGGETPVGLFQQQ